MITTRLKQIRERRGMRASQLAAETGVARQTIYAIESGSFVPNTVVALQLARALDVSVEDLFEIAAEQQATSANVEAELLDETAYGDHGSPIRLCRVGERSIAVPVQISPSWLPGANAVIDVRRSSKSVSTRFLSTETELQNNILIAGCDPAISILSRFLIGSDGIDLAAFECSSRRALELLKSGKVHVAGMHLRDEKTGEFNLPFAREAFPRGGFRLVTYGKWEQGFVVAAGNPLGIQSAEHLTGRKVKIVNREVGAGSREVLDRLLRMAGVKHGDVRGYEHTCSGHLSAAQGVLTKEADCCIATRNAASTLGLGFVPLTEERYDFVTLSRFASEPPVKVLFDALNRLRFRQQLSSLAGYDTSETGSVRT